MKKVINFQEAATRRILLKTATRYGAEVFAKMRVADVLGIEGSGLDAALYSYALRAHFDFVVVDEKFLPLFAVEFDGPSHQEALTMSDVATRGVLPIPGK